MVTFIKIINFLFIIVLFLYPFLLKRLLNKSNVKFKHMFYLMFGGIMTLIIPILFAWWNNESTILLLKHYNGYWYNPDSGSYQVEYYNVLPKNVEIVKNLERSYMGIGWPLKAIFGFIFFSPLYYLYLLFVYSLNSKSYAIFKP